MWSPTSYTKNIIFDRERYSNSDDDMNENPVHDEDIDNLQEGKSWDDRNEEIYDRSRLDSDDIHAAVASIGSGDMINNSNNGGDDGDVNYNGDNHDSNDDNHINYYSNDYEDDDDDPEDLMFQNVRSSILGKYCTSDDVRTYIHTLAYKYSHLHVLELIGYNEIMKDMTIPLEDRLDAAELHTNYNKYLHINDDSLEAASSSGGYTLIYTHIYTCTYIPIYTHAINVIIENDCMVDCPIVSNVNVLLTKNFGLDDTFIFARKEDMNDDGENGNKITEKTKTCSHDRSVRFIVDTAPPRYVYHDLLECSIAHTLTHLCLPNNARVIHKGGTYRCVYRVAPV